jgi:hypothetical protein
MRQPTAQDLRDLLADHRGPCITIYQQTHRQYPGILEDPIRFKNLLTRAEEILAAKNSNWRSYKDLLRKIEAVPEAGKEFWTHQLDGMGIFCCPDYFLAVSLQSLPLEDSVTVNDNFRTTPLVRALQATGRYQVLCFEMHNVRLFEGNQFALDAVPLRNVPTSAEQLKTEPHWIRHYLNGAGNYGRTAIAKPSTREVDLDHEHDAELIRFMRVVDRAIWENHSRQANLPLILCAAAADHPLFMRLSQNDNLMPVGVKLDPHRQSAERIREEAWKIVAPRYQKRVEEIVDAFRTARAQNLASDRPETVTEAAASGRVATLLVDSTKHIRGMVDPVTGYLLREARPEEESIMGDVMDETAERVLRTGGQVLVIPPDVMPTDSGMAAIYRY